MDGDDCLWLMLLHAFVGGDWGIWGAYGGLCVRATVGACDGHGDISSGSVCSRCGDISRGTGRAVFCVVGGSVGFLF